MKNNNNILPNDWEVKELGEVGKLSKGKGILKDQVISSGLSCIRYGEIYMKYNFVVNKLSSFILEETAEES